MFAIDTLAGLVQRARQAFRTYLPGSDAWSWPNNIYASAKVLGGVAFEVSGFLAYVSKMIFASTAPDIETLILHGNEFGLPLLPSAPAEGPVTIIAPDAIVVAGGATLQRSDGVTYLVTSGGTLTGAGSLQATVTCAQDGALANAVEGTPLTILSGVTGPGSANATCQVGPGDIVEGTDVEDKESYRQRILFRKRNPPHGGAPSDYVLWARMLSGVTRVFVERTWAGSGTVRVFFFMDRAFANGIPDDTAVLRLSLFLQTLEPASAIVTVAAPLPHNVAVPITNLVPNTVTVQENVRNELRAMFLRKGRVCGNDSPHPGMPFLATPTTFPVAWIYQAIANAEGVESFDLGISSDTVLSAGETAVLGPVTFSP